MKIKELKRLVDKAYKNGKDADVEFYLINNKLGIVELVLDYVGQFSVIPDIVINFRTKADAEEEDKHE